MKETKPVSPAAVFVIFLGLGQLFLFPEGILNAAWPKEKRADPPIIESPAVRYEEEKAAPSPAYEKFSKADMIFTGRIQEIALSKMGFGGPGIPEMRIKFRDAVAIKGSWPGEEHTFHYRGEAKRLEFPRGERLLVAVKKREGSKRSWWVTEVIRATKTNRDIIQSWIHPAPPTEGSKETDPG